MALICTVAHLSAEKALLRLSSYEQGWDCSDSDIVHRFTGQGANDPEEDISFWCARQVEEKI
jgi:hypothetical protein